MSEVQRREFLSGPAPFAAGEAAALTVSGHMTMPARNIAELLCDLGILLRWRMRRQAGTNRESLLVQSLRWDGQMALGFVNLTPSIQLRAMVEDWPLHRIRETIQSQRRETLHPQVK